MLQKSIQQIKEIYNKILSGSRIDIGVEKFQKTRD